MPRFMGFVRMEEGVGTPPQALFDAMDVYIGEQAAKGVFLDGGGLYGAADRRNSYWNEAATADYVQALEEISGAKIWAVGVGPGGNKVDFVIEKRVEDVTPQIVSSR